MKELLKVKNLSVSFPVYHGLVRAVRDVSFTIREGETLAMAGESGCGKSVTAKAIMRLLDRTSAIIDPVSEVNYHGQNLLTLKKRELNLVRGNEIGMIFQDAFVSLNPTMTVGNPPAGEAGTDLSDDFPRSFDGASYLRPDRSDVSGNDRRICGCKRTVQPADASLYKGVVFSHSPGGSGERMAKGTDSSFRRSAESGGRISGM